MIFLLFGGTDFLLVLFNANPYSYKDICVYLYNREVHKCVLEKKCPNLGDPYGPKQLSSLFPKIRKWFYKFPAGHMSTENY